MVGVAVGVIPMDVEVEAAAGEVDPIKMVAAHIMISLEIIIQKFFITTGEGVAGVVGSLITTMVQQFKVVKSQLMWGSGHDITQ